MNIITAYNIASFLDKTEKKSAVQGWTFENDGAVFLSYRWVQQALNRQENLTESLQEMTNLGLIEIKGDGSRGNAKTVALAMAGRGFLKNFSNGIGLQALMVSPDVWEKFFNQVIFRDLDITTELVKVLRQYKEPKTVESALTHNPQADAPADPNAEIAF